jgi:hypothetical protein
VSAWDWLWVAAIGFLIVLAGLVAFLTAVWKLRPQRAGDPSASYDPAKDRTIIITQLGLGTLLVLVGAALGVIVHEVGPDSANDIALSIATAVIGVGAALLPAGAAATASSRILQSLPERGEEKPVATTSDRRADLGSTEVEFAGRLDPKGRSVRWYFEYGDTDQLGRYTRATDAEWTSGERPVASEMDHFVGDTPNRAIDLYYRLVAIDTTTNEVFRGEVRKLEKPQTGPAPS